MTLCRAYTYDLLATGTAVSWEALFIYDVLIVSLTLFKAYRERARRRITSGNDLFGLIVRDGAS